MSSKLYLLLFIAAFTRIPTIYGQAPGGVPASAWYKADGSNTIFSDAGVTPAANNATVQQWNSITGSFPLLQATAGSRPVFSSTSVLANFNPTVTFDGSNDWMQFTAGAGVNIIDRANGTFYAAGYMNLLKRSGFAGFHPTMDYPGMHFFSDNKLLFFTGGPGYQGLSPDVMQAQTYFTAGSGWQNGSGSSAAYAGATVSLNGNRALYSGSQLNNANLSTAARDFRIGADNNYGSFSGQLNEVLLFEDRLTAAQMDQVETYLALKYGTTYANGSRDYKNSTGTTVWNAVANNGYHYNIAGIARDDMGALYQKQAWSTNAGQQVLIGVGGLANTNAANSGTLADNQYLVWGDNGQPKAPTVSLTGIAGLSHRFASIWKVQHNGSGTVRVAWVKGLSNLTLIQSTDAIINGSDVPTAMTGEITVNGVIYNYADVTLANGQYFTFGAKLAGPGGVTDNLRVWLKSNEGFTPSSWTDFSGFNNHYTQTNTSRQPFTATTLYNFNPVIDFGNNTSANGRFMVVPSGKPFSANGLSGTFFTTTLTRAGGTSGYRDIWGFGATTTGAGLINADVPTITKLNNNIVLYSSTTSAFPNLYPDNKFLLSDMSYTVGVAGIKYGLNGATASTTQTRTAAGSLQANGSVLGAQPQVTNGVIGEAIAYERDLTEAEKQRVRTYTAIKYGITLPHNYIASDGSTVVWNQSTNAGYTNNIAGLANDEGSALHQKQSNSINDGQQVLISTTGLANSNAANAVSLSSGQFLVWGDNGQAKSLGISHSTTVGGNPINLRMGAVWKVQNTGAVGTVRIAWRSGIVNLHLIQSPDATIDIADTHTPMNGTITVNSVVYNYADVTLINGSYFTFGGYVAGPGGVGQDLSLWYRADNGVETDAAKKVTAWNNSTANDVKLTMSSANAYVPYNDQTTFTKTWNFNPTLSFDGTNNYLRNTTTAYLNTAGSVHYIAVARLNPAASSYNSLFSISGNDDGFFLYPQSGQVYPMPSIGNGFGATAAGPGSTNRFGIYSSILPKTGSPANQRGFYNGLEKIYTAPYPRTGAAYVLPTTGAYIGADGTTGDNPDGEIAEVILYHEPAGGDMANASLARIHSYLAVKYGITLDQTIPQNYVNSTGAVVWNATNNAGYHYNIAGIARDDQGGLYQRQSRSVNSGRQVLISTTGLASTNAGNTGVLANGQFLIWGDNNLAKAPAVPFGIIGGIPYLRFAAIWKAANVNAIGTVRVAWPKGLAYLKLVQSTDNVFDLGDVITDMSGTQMVNGVEYAYADVTITDGQYFTFAAYIQAPGGVTNNISYWYRADKFAESVAEGTEVSSWTDFTSGTVVDQIGENALPVSAKGGTTYFNYNPGIKFTTANQSLANVNVQTVTNLSYDIFTVTKEGIGAGSNGRIFSSLVNNSNQSGSINYWDGIGIMADQRMERMNVAYSNRYLANPGNILYSTNSPSIMYTTFTDLSVAKGLNGATSGAAGTHTARGQLNGGHAFGSTVFSGNGSDNAGFTGDIGELIIYGNGNVTATERNKVESYLAIKYGVTLQNSNNYTTSQNVVVWDATANSGFYNNVAGIGQDFISALHQKQSRSQHANTNNQVIIALGEIAESNLENENQVNDGQFLIWGDNGNTQAMTSTAGTYAAFPYAGSTANGRRMNRIWKVQNTNNLNNQVMIRFPQTSVGTTTFPANDPCAGYVIVFADDAAFTTNITVKPLTVNGTDYEVLHSFAAGTGYFTFGKAMPLNNGEVYLAQVIEETDIYNDGCSVGEWAYYRQTTDLNKKLLGLSGYTNGQLDNFDVTITPEGTSYNDGVRITNLMPRISTVTDNNTGAIASGKVRVYYSPDEMGASLVPGATTSGWFFYDGPADDAIIDIYSDGVFDAGKSRPLVVAQSGIEDGVYYVEFHTINDMGSFLYLSSTENTFTLLPVTLLYFAAQEQSGKTLLTWATATEKNNSGFGIEHSLDGINWRNIDFVATKASGGNSLGRLNYEYIHQAPANGKNFYRLKQIDIDERFVYSPVSTVTFGEFNRIKLSPNPVNTTLFITGLSGKYVISVLNVSGQVVKTIRTDGGSTMQVDVSTLASGMYLIRIESSTGNQESYKVIKR
ncbi:T9SS type A sorting domain-containing protein [Terrimonas ferruginea]|uniref:T9SS type A sorting domain-containing protein n=1 Tax=Terrimonas ferruginea TaxID=249 RepID=UPI000412C288|nr:T9SS type A sorting domain-containing protein [Terrimonas ferruginea]